MLADQTNGPDSEAVAEVVYELARWRQLDDQQWLLLLVAAVVLAVGGFVCMMVRRDTADLRRPLAYLLFGLRLAAFAGLLLFFFDLQKRIPCR